MWKKLSLRGNYKWIDILSDLLKRYNGKVQRTIGMRPKDVTARHEARLLKKFSFISKRRSKPKFKLGDKVWISKYKHVFEKKYTPNFMTEVFTIVRVSSYLSSKGLQRQTHSWRILWAGDHKGQILGRVSCWKSVKKKNKSNLRKVVRFWQYA